MLAKVAAKGAGNVTGATVQSNTSGPSLQGASYAPTTPTVPYQSQQGAPITLC